jgi:hypothetical protein
MRATITAIRRTITAARTVHFLDLNDPRLTTISGYLAGLGADAALIRSTKSVLGGRIKKAFAKASLTRSGLLTRIKPKRCHRSWLTVTPAYTEAQLPILADVVAGYPKTAHLIADRKASPVDTTALAATITGTLLTLAPIDPAAVRNAHRTIDPDAPMWMDPTVTRLLGQLAEVDKTIARETRYLMAIDWHYGYDTRNHFAWLDNARQARGLIEDRILAAYGVTTQLRLAA